MRYRTQDLDGRLLDAAVARVVGATIRPSPDGEGAWLARGGGMVPWYAIPQCSQEWKDGGPLIERYDLAIASCKQIVAAKPIEGQRMDGWAASGPWAQGGQLTIWGPTALVAAMRCLVVGRFGDWIDLP